MERLTERKYGKIVSSKREKSQIHCSHFCNGCSQGTGDCGYVREMVQKLADYEDKEEKGLLISLPCKVGTTVWYICQHDTISLSKNMIYEAEVTRVYFTEEVLLALRIRYEWGVTEFSNIGDFGKTVFLTRSEAEEAQAKMGE